MAAATHRRNVCGREIEEAQATFAQQKSEVGRDAELADATVAPERDIAAIKKQQQKVIDMRARMDGRGRCRMSPKGMKGMGEGPGSGAVPRADGAGDAEGWGGGAGEQAEEIT